MQINSLHPHASAPLPPARPPGTTADVQAPAAAANEGIRRMPERLHLRGTQQLGWRRDCPETCGVRRHGESGVSVGYRAGRGRRSRRCERLRVARVFQLGASSVVGLGASQSSFHHLVLLLFRSSFTPSAHTIDSNFGQDLAIGLTGRRKSRQPPCGQRASSVSSLTVLLYTPFSLLVCLIVAAFSCGPARLGCCGRVPLFPHVS